MGKTFEALILINLAVLGAQLSVEWEKAYWVFSFCVACFLLLIEYLRERRE